MDERDEDELNELADAMPPIAMNGNCHRDRKVSAISATDSVEMSCASVSMESGSGSPLFDRR